ARRWPAGCWPPSGPDRGAAGCCPPRPSGAAGPPARWAGAGSAAPARGTGGPTAMRAVAGLAVAAWGLALPGSAWVWGLAIAGTGIATGLFYPRFFAAMTTAAPPELRARGLASVTLAISAPAPRGFHAAG